MDDEVEKPKRRYQFSSKQKEKIKLRKRIFVKRKQLSQLENKNENSKKKSKGVIQKKVNATSRSAIIFEPNEGPQYSFLASPEKEVLYGGAAGGGKSFAMLMDLLRFAGNNNHRALLLRRTLAELTELIDKSKQVYPRAFPGAKFKESTKTWIFPSGATALFSYVDQDDDVYRYQGMAFSWIGIDELGHYPTPFVWNYLRSRLRTTDPSIETYMRATANPGGVGGWWIKKMFIDPSPPDEPFFATDTDTGKTLVFGQNHKKAGEPLFRRKFIPARLTDNPYLMQDGEYETMLLSLPEVQRRRLLEGDWNVSEGAVFTEFSPVSHIVVPEDLPYNWIRIRSCDYGFSSPSCVLWGAIDWDGCIWIYRELYQTRLTAEELASVILELEALDPPIHASILDKSCWNRTGLGRSIAQTMIEKGVRWLPSNSDRMQGKQEVHRRLLIDEYGQSRIKIFNTCTNLIRTLPSLPMSKTNSEDVDTRADDHAYDALRYMFMSQQSSRPSSRPFGMTHLNKPIIQDEVFGY
tara:strand:- start:507 stop:2072 length:1566 start_codon:yes stop_codon:yes gene_type:complete